MRNWLSRGLGASTPVNFTIRIGSIGITVDQAMEVDKAESIPVKPLVIGIVINFHLGGQELISSLG